MAYILSKVGQSFNVSVHIYEADTEEDMNSIDIQGVPMGSKCHIINDGKWYMLNSERKWKAMSLSGGGVQSDWNQNDSTQPDYVKNRPFYTGDPVETVFVEESTVEFVDTGEGFYMAEFPSTFEATVGEIYKVSWDGTTYECTCVKFNNNPFIGNLSIVGAGSDTGEPFLMGIINGKGINIGTSDTSASHTFSISATVVPVVKIDPKYIRDMYYTSDPVETVLVEESTVSFSFAESEGIYIGELQSTFSATVGETYNVSWDGTVYECACVKFNRRPAIGNLSIIGASSDTGEPFLVVVSNNRKIRIGTADTSATHTISISGFVQEVVKIDEKYIPDTVATKSEVEAAQSTADAAQSTANAAQSTAETAQSIAETAKSTANAAQSTADTAQAAANSASSQLSKMATKADPVFTGTFSQNRRIGSTSGAYSHAEGRLATASGSCSHAEGESTTASGRNSHAEGESTTASGRNSHAEGGSTTASGEYSHAEGAHTTASGGDSHAEGGSTTALGTWSHAEGSNCIAQGANQHVQGKYNIASGTFNGITKSDYCHIVGNGESDSERSNAHTLTWSGIPWYQGRPQFGGTSMDNGSQTVMANGDKEIILASSTANSTKKFRITVDDSGTLTATEVV